MVNNLFFLNQMYSKMHDIIMQTYPRPTTFNNFYIYHADGFAVFLKQSAA